MLCSEFSLVTRHRWQHLEDAVRLQESWHVARCLKRFTTLSTNDRVIIFRVGGKVGGRRGKEGGRGRVGNFCPTQAHAACDTLLMRCSELFQSLFEPVLTLCSEFCLVTCHRWRI